MNELYLYYRTDRLAAGTPHHIQMPIYYKNTAAVSLTRSLDIVEINTNIVVVIVTSHGKINRCLVDTGSLGKLTILLQVSRLICAVFVDNIHLFILKVTLSDQYDISSSDPDLLAHLSTNMSEAGDSIKAEAFTTAVSQHFNNLGILLSFLLEFKLALGFFSVSLSSPAVLSTLSYRLT